MVCPLFTKGIVFVFVFVIQAAAYLAFGLPEADLEITGSLKKNLENITITAI